MRWRLNEELASLHRGKEKKKKRKVDAHCCFSHLSKFSWRAAAAHCINLFGKIFHFFFLFGWGGSLSLKVRLTRFSSTGNSMDESLLNNMALDFD